MSQLRAEPRPTSLTESAYQKIRGAILDSELVPSQPVSVVSLAQSLEMSRSPVRAAIGRIVSEGLLERAGAGFVVSEIKPKMLFDSLEVRELLEGRAAELAVPHLTPETIEKLVEIHGQFVRAYETGDARGAMKADLAFHQTILEACGNEALVEHLDTILTRIMVATYSEAWSVQSQLEGVPEHTAILAAIQSRDPLLVRVAVSSHTHSANERLQLEWAARHGAPACGTQAPE